MLAGPQSTVQASSSPVQAASPPGPAAGTVFDVYLQYLRTRDRPAHRTRSTPRGLTMAVPRLGRIPLLGRRAGENPATSPRAHQTRPTTPTSAVCLSPPPCYAERGQGGHARFRVPVGHRHIRRPNLLWSAAPSVTARPITLPTRQITRAPAQRRYPQRPSSGHVRAPPGLSRRVAHRQGTPAAAASGQVSSSHRIPIRAGSPTSCRSRLAGCSPHPRPFGGDQLSSRSPRHPALRRPPRSTNRSTRGHHGPPLQYSWSPRTSPSRGVVR